MSDLLHTYLLDIMWFIIHKLPSGRHTDSSIYYWFHLQKKINHTALVDARYLKYFILTNIP